MPKDYSNQKPIAWFTSNGVHLPIYKGETKNDALQRMRNTINQPLNNNYIQFGDNIGIALSKARKFMHNNSTLDMWQDSLSKDELYSIVEYTKGAGIYVANISDNRTENEFLFGRHTVLKYDLNSLYFNNNSWYINAQYIDQYTEE